MKSYVEEALNQLEANDVMERVTHSDWTALIMTVSTRDGSIRLCGDYIITVNPVLEFDPLPQPENIFATLAGGKTSTTLDLSHAYNQLILDEESRSMLL